MKTNEVENIKNLISKAEVEKAKSQGVIENIKSEWKKRYGFETLEEAKTKVEELTNEYNKNEKKKEKLIVELRESQDWDKIEEELDD